MSPKKSKTPDKKKKRRINSQPNHEDKTEDDFEIFNVKDYGERKKLEKQKKKLEKKKLKEQEKLKNL
jgi:hypothetical protein